MASYDPQANRKRSPSSAESPVDALLDPVDHSINLEKDYEVGIGAKNISSEEKNENFKREKFRPFEVPDLEGIDEKADRFNRVVAFSALTIFFTLAFVLRKRRLVQD